MVLYSTCSFCLFVSTLRSLSSFLPMAFTFHPSNSLSQLCYLCVYMPPFAFSPFLYRMLTLFHLISCSANLLLFLSSFHPPPSERTAKSLENFNHSPSSLVYPFPLLFILFISVSQPLSTLCLTLSPLYSLLLVCLLATLAASLLHCQIHKLIDRVQGGWQTRAMPFPPPLKKPPIPHWKKVSRVLVIVVFKRYGSLCQISEFGEYWMNVVGWVMKNNCFA